MKKEVSPVLAVIVALLVIGGLVFAYTRMNPPGPKKSNAELQAHKPAPKIPPLGPPPTG